MDQLRTQSLGYAGDRQARTAALDRFAAESQNLINAISGSPVCSPYRASLLSGQYPATNGLSVNDVPFQPKASTLAESFAKSGYRTAYIGKWHLHGSPGGSYERRTAPVPREARFGWDYWKACECTHDYNKSVYYTGDDPLQRTWPGYDAEAQTADADRYIREAPQAKQPWLLALSLGPPHDPYQTAPPRYRELFANADLQLRANVPGARRTPALRDLRGYYAHLAALDDCFARLLRAVDESGQRGNTIVIFTSDHGDMLESQGLSRKQVPWEESIRVPFLLRDPRSRTKPRTLPTLLNTPDIFPTLASLCGVTIPGPVQGRDLSSIIAGARRPERDDVALLGMPSTYSVMRRTGFAEYRGIRTQRHTYVRTRSGPWLLYDNERDPLQMRNSLIDARLLRTLDRRLDAELKRAHDDFLPSDEYVRRANCAHYREVQAPIGQTQSPWGDWSSTLTKP